MRGNNSMNTISLACKERAQKASEVRKQMVKISNQKCSVYRCTFIRPVNTNQARLRWPSILNAQEKAKEKGGKAGEKGGKNGENIAKKKPKKKHLYAHTFSPLCHDLS